MSQSSVNPLPSAAGPTAPGPAAAPGPQVEGVTLGGADLSDVTLHFTQQEFLEAGAAAEPASLPAAVPVAAAERPYEAALPIPDPLAAQQFMPVLPPEQFGALLRDLTGQLQLIPDDAARALLSMRGRLLALNVEQYRVNYKSAHQNLNRVLAETGVGVRDAWSRQQDHLRFMNAASSTVESEYARATQQIEQARSERFRVLSLHGARPDTPDAEALYGQLALAELAAEDSPIRPPDQKSGSKRVFNAFAVLSKFFVGLISGVSINLLFNPESRLYLTLIALSAGVMFSVLLLWLIDELAYRAKLAPYTRRMARPWGYVSGIVLVSLIYLGVEGYLNWDGILRVTQQIAANAAQQGQLTDLASAPDAPSTPEHWSLLTFTLGLVSMAIGSAIIQGRERARNVLERERLAGRVAQLKLGRQFTDAARATDQVAYLENQRQQLAPPRDVTSPDHARLNERVLTHWEQERDAQVGSLGSTMTQDAAALQRALEDYAAQVLEARYPTPRRGLLGR